MASQRRRDWHRPDDYLDRDSFLDSRPIFIVGLTPLAPSKNPRASSLKLFDSQITALHLK